MHTKGGCTAHLIASQIRQSDIISKHLIGDIADVNLQTKDDGTVLLITAPNGHSYIVKYLKEANADFNTQAEGSYAALTIAAQNSHNDIVKYRTEANADVILQTKDDCTGLIIAAQNGHSDVIKCLMKQMPMLICRLKMVMLHS